MATQEQQRTSLASKTTAHALILTLTLFAVLGCKVFSKNEAVTPDSPASSMTPTPIMIAELHPEKEVRRIAFGSCAHQKFPQPIWAPMLAQHPDIYLGMGDNIYASRPEDKPVAKMYELQAQIPEFKAFRAEVPMIAVWDDHDFGINDGGADNKDKDDYKAEYLKFFPNDAKVITAAQGKSLEKSGVYHSFILGSGKNTVQIIMLDTRYYRSDLEKQEHPKNPLDIYRPTKDKSKTFLGSEQWAWLEKEFKKKAAITIIVSSVQLIHQDHGFEKWANFPRERDRLLKLIGQSHKKNIILVSGDRHQGEIHRMVVPGYGALYDITASGINRTTTLKSEPSKTRIGEFYPKENFGLFEINWEKKSIQTSLIGLNGQLVQAIEIKLK